MDGTIPRAKLPLVLRRMQELSAKYGLRVANVFHAGDGNLHPLILYDANKPGELDRAEAFGADILRLCVEVGGVLTGEHGVGVEKRDLMPTMFSEVDLNQQQRLKCAFDDQGLLNPGKVFPTLHRCAELGRMHVHAGRSRRFPIFRGSDGHGHERKSQTARRSGGRAGHPTGRSPAARRSKSSAMAPNARSAGRRNGTPRSIYPGCPASRCTSRPSWCCPPRPARRWPRSRRWRPQAGRRWLSSRWITDRCSVARRAPARSAARWRRTFPARAASRPAPRAIISSVSTPFPGAARRSNPAAGW